MPGAARHVVLGAAGGTLGRRAGVGGPGTAGASGDSLRAMDVPDGVELVAVDVASADGARRACDGAAVVYHCAQPDYTKWAKLFPPLTEAVLDGAAAAGAKLVFADNLYMYGPPNGPMTEQTPSAPRPQGPHSRRDGRGHPAGSRRRQTALHDRPLFRLLRPRGTGTTAGDSIISRRCAANGPAGSALWTNRIPSTTSTTWVEPW